MWIECPAYLEGLKKISGKYRSLKRVGVMTQNQQDPGGLILKVPYFWVTASKQCLTGNQKHQIKNILLVVLVQGDSWKAFWEG